MRPLILSCVIMIIFASCNKDKEGAEEVNIYLLKSFQFLPGKCQVNAAASALRDTPLINNGDILAYSPHNHQFRLKDDAFQKVRALTDFTPFAVTVGKDVIYYGIFKVNISSASCDHSIVMEAGVAPEVFLRLGYPASSSTSIEDHRNHPRLISALKAQGKIK